MIISGLKGNKCILTPTALLLHCIFYDINLTISPLDRPITAAFTKDFP